MTPVFARSLLLPALCGALFTLAGCGGGGNELGPADSLQASPEVFTVNGGPSCFRGTGPTVHVYGGLPPYTLKNSLPSGMSLNKTTLNAAGEGFVVTLSGTCIQSLPITIEDDMGRVMQVLVTNEHD